MAKQDFYEFFLPSVIPDRKAAAGAVAAGSIAGFLLVFTTIKAPFDGRAPAIYVADPWSPTSEAVVEWSHEKGGIPWGRKPLLFYLITVREALQFFGADYDDRIAVGEVDAMCAKLSYHITQRNAQRVSRTKGDI